MGRWTGWIRRIGQSQKSAAAVLGAAAAVFLIVSMPLLASPAEDAASVGGAAVPVTEDAAGAVPATGDDAVTDTDPAMGDTAVTDTDPATGDTAVAEDALVTGDAAPASGDADATEERSPAEDPVPGPEADAVTVDRAESVLAAMDLREKVYQLFIVFPEDLVGEKGITFAGERTRAALEERPVGGLIYDRTNMVSQAQVRRMMADTRSMCEIGPILTCDEEGGRVNRLMGAVGTPYVGPMLRYKDQGPETASANARTIASGIVSCGLNMDLAPVADVWSSPENRVIGDRAYSDDPWQAAELVSAAVAGFHEGGVACCLKHFPGHGDTREDSHTGTAYVYKTLDQIREAELVPFRAGIAAGADAVMVGHLALPEIDDDPAPFSYRIVTELLREELGFDGVVMTDSLQMGAVVGDVSSGEAAVRALRAGADVLLAPESLSGAAEGIFRALDAGELTEARLDESVLRILRLKDRWGML